MTKNATKQWKPAVLKLDQPEEGKWPYKAYAQYGEGKRAVYDLNATMRDQGDAWMEAKALSDAYNRNAVHPSQCPTRVSTAKLPAGTFMLAPPPNPEREEALRRLIALGEEMARNRRPGPQ
jgi:hypothetical protein